MNKNKNEEIIKKNTEKNITDEQKQRYKEAKKQYKMTDEQKQKRRDYQKEYVKNMTDEQIQKYKDYRKEYYKKYYAAKKLNNNKIINDSDNDDKIIDDSDNDNKIIDGSDNVIIFITFSIIIKFLNAF